MRESTQHTERYLQAGAPKRLLKSQEMSLLKDIKDAIDKICVQAEQAANDGYQFLILSDRNVDSKHVPVSTVLACGAVHHHLIMTRLRSKCGIILETGLKLEANHS